MPSVNDHRYFATCARGLEPILAEELIALGAEAVVPGRGGVAFAGDRTLLFRANLWLRTAIRVLVPILEASVASSNELYDAVRSVDWSQFLTTDHTLAVDANVRDSAITHSQYAARRVKDAICDQFRERTGGRPSVDTEQPMLGLNLHIYRNAATLSLDSSGESLHKRGYRPVQTIAPLNEALAAALILRSGWNGDAPFIDPLCGSGTLPIEAAWIALRRPPGLTRKHFGFMGWMDFDIAEWTAIRDEARRHVGKLLDYPILGADQRRDVIEMARANARTAGIGNMVQLDMSSLHDLQPAAGPTGMLLCNPPYGERIGEEQELVGLYRKLGEVARERFTGWKLWVFTGNARLANEIGLPRVEEVALFNGKIPCKLIRFA
jgi:putative N6-adenine-specific DNA methylase